MEPLTSPRVSLHICQEVRSLLEILLIRYTYPCNLPLQKSYPFLDVGVLHS